MCTCCHTFIYDSFVVDEVGQDYEVMLGRTGSPSIYIASLKHFIAKVILLDGKATAQALQVG